MYLVVSARLHRVNDRGAMVNLRVQEGSLFSPPINVIASIQAPAPSLAPLCVTSRRAHPIFRNIDS